MKQVFAYVKLKQGDTKQNEITSAITDANTFCVYQHHKMIPQSLRQFGVLDDILESILSKELPTNDVIF